MALAYLQLYGLQKCMVVIFFSYSTLTHNLFPELLHSMLLLFSEISLGLTKLSKEIQYAISRYIYVYIQWTYEINLFQRVFRKSKSS